MHVEVEVKRENGTAETPPWSSDNDEQESASLAAFLIAVDVVGRSVTGEWMAKALDDSTQWPAGLTRPDDPDVRDAITALAKGQPDLLQPFGRFAFAEPPTPEGLDWNEEAWQKSGQLVGACYTLRNSIPELSVLDTRYPFLKAALGTLYEMLKATPSQRVRLSLMT